MEPLVTAAESREFDSQTIQQLGIESSLLMEHAALAVVHELKSRFQKCFQSTTGLILCGPGNNGADALAVSRILALDNFLSFKLVFFETDRTNEAFQKQFHILESLLGEKFSNFICTNTLGDFDWVVDGIFGTGLSKPLSFEIQKTLTEVNQKNSYRIAVDVPTGLNSDTGVLLPIGFEAHTTVTMGFVKRGLVTGQGANVVGKLKLAPLQIPRALAKSISCHWFQEEDAKRVYPQRLPSSHKGQFGTVGVALGHPSMIGASVLSSLAAYSAGAGVVTLFGEKQKLELVRSKVPMAILTTEEIPDKAEALVIGPGLGIELPSIDKLRPLLALEKKLVLDADALNLLSLIDDFKELVARRNHPTVLTPHPKEAARLLKTTVESVEGDRFGSVAKIANLFNATVILKGKGSLIASGKKTYVVTQGSPALSKGGSGDILAGIVASLMGQKLEPLEAAALGCYILGRASELLVEEQGEDRTHLPGNLLAQFSSVFYELGQ